MPGLDIGITLPTIDGGEILEAVGGIGGAARHVEDLGLESVWVADLIVGDGTPALDSVVSLAIAAEATRRLRLGFGVLALPLRPVAWVAAQVGTLQQVSGGRVLLGVGSGGFPDTPFWQAVGVAGNERGSRTDAALAVLPSLITGQPAIVEHGQAAVRLAPSKMPPVLVGGNSEIAIRRAAVHGDAWFPSLISPDAVADGKATLGRLATERGRGPLGITVGGHAMLGSDASIRSAREGFLRNLVDEHGMTESEAATIPIAGRPAEVAERLAAYAEAGADRLVLSADGEDWKEQCELMAEARALLD